MIHVPDPNPIQTDFEGSAYEGGVLQDELVYETGTIEVGVGGSDDNTRIKAVSWDFSLDQILWTAVYWCRAHGVPDGTVRVMSELDELPPYRLSGLYRLAGFDFWDSERQ